MEQPKTRPIGITILSGLCLGYAVMSPIGVLLIVHAAQSGDPRTPLYTLGVPLTFWGVLVAVSIPLKCTLAIAASIGMWKGRKWGWYLGSFFHLYKFFAYLRYALVILPTMLSTIDPVVFQSMRHGPSCYYFRCSAWVIISFLLYLYFFKGNVKTFFNLSEQPMRKTIAVQAALCIVLVGWLPIVLWLIN